jgi:transposase InsO family protein
VKRRRLIDHVCDVAQISERRACSTLNIHRSTYRYQARKRPDEERLRVAITDLVYEYGAYGYRLVTGTLRNQGWKVNHKRVERIWREEGLKIPAKQKKRKHLWFTDGSCVRLRPEYRNHVWSYDFVMDRTSNGKAFRMLTLIDEYTRECLAIMVDRTLTRHDVLECLEDAFVRQGVPKHIRSGNGPEFRAKQVCEWLTEIGVKTQFIEPGSPWENGYNESFNGTLRRELLDREVVDTMYETKVLVERWRKEYNTVRPHSALNYRPPAPEAIVPVSELERMNIGEFEQSGMELYRLN